MAYFPMFVDLNNKSVLIVGGGVVALRKLEKLLPYGPRVTVAAPEIDERILELQPEIIRERFSPDMLDGRAMVIAATNDASLNHSIAVLCQERNIPVNVVDDREWCSFLFPALVQSGELSVGISTGGASPSAAIWLKEQISSLLPDSFSDILSFLEGTRPLIRESFQEEKQRSQVFKKLFSRCMELGRVLTTAELSQLIDEEEQ